MRHILASVALCALAASCPAAALAADPIGYTAQDGVNAVPVTSSNPLPVAAQAQRLTPAAGAAAAVTTGGTAATVATGPINGGFVQNPSSASAQGVAAAENAYVNMVAAPGATDAAANGTTSLLLPGQTFYLPALPAGVAVKANAATSGHKLTVVTW